tara:strand:- start:152 stop:352 length:201 start_codon:yes stop_codon:yes gene_type:complete
MKELQKFEEMFMIFASSLSQFGSEIEQANFKHEIGMISYQTSRKLQDLYSEIENDLERLKEYQKIK